MGYFAREYYSHLFYCSQLLFWQTVLVCQGLLVCQGERAWGGGSDSAQRSTNISQKRINMSGRWATDPPAQPTAIHLALFHPYFDPRLSGKLSNPEEDGEVRI